MKQKSPRSEREKRVTLPILERFSVKTSTNKMSADQISQQKFGLAGTIPSKDGTKTFNSK